MYQFWCYIWYLIFSSYDLSDYSFRYSHDGQMYKHGWSGHFVGPCLDGQVVEQMGGRMDECTNWQITVLYPSLSTFPVWSSPCMHACTGISLSPDWKSKESLNERPCSSRAKSPLSRWILIQTFIHSFSQGFILRSIRGFGCSRLVVKPYCRVQSITYLSKGEEESKLFFFIIYFI